MQLESGGGMPMVWELAHKAVCPRRFPRTMDIET